MDDDNKRRDEPIALINQADALHLVQSPPLIRATEWSSEGAIDANQFASALLRLLETKRWPMAEEIPLRVGRYAESLLRQSCIQAEADFPVLAQNLQIFNERATIGELDLVINAPEAPLHLELAVKLYLGLPEHSQSLDGWVGPNPRDTLGKKYRHLKFKQLPLSDTPQARQALGLSRVDTIHQYPWIKGYLFHYEDQALALPREVEASHKRGWWTIDSNPWRPHPDREVRYCIPPKPYWIKYFPSDIPQFNSWKALREASASHIEQRLTCHVIAVCQTTNNIVSRGFIASEAWLRAARALSAQLISEYGNQQTSEVSPHSGS